MPVLPTIDSPVWLIDGVSIQYIDRATFNADTQTFQNISHILAVPVGTPGPIALDVTREADTARSDVPAPGGPTRLDDVHRSDEPSTVHTRACDIS
ncbi:hypothetical protein Sar04_00380 [Salinispora arenicola]|uniref:Uncharacterized protein n=1 Tax=Salinispora arenicola TaxID=168697 RepID=A0ABQ4JKI1_SALAC|nr:hypothetical protein Sar04_00380 [Salinispora arenicola]